MSSSSEDDEESSSSDGSAENQSEEEETPQAEVQDVRSYKRGEPVSIVDGNGTIVGEGFIADDQPDPDVSVPL